MNQDVLEAVMVTCDIADHPRHDLPLTSILLYIIDGLLPLLSAFFKQLKSHSDDTDKVVSEVLPSEIREIFTLGSNFAVSCTI